MKLPQNNQRKKIHIFDTTLRDGEQSPGASLTVKEKLIIAKQLAKLGVDVIEAGFPISSKGDFKAVQLIAKTIPNVVICGLARTVKEDIDRCYEAIKHAEKPRIHTFIATSHIHLEKKLRKTKEEVINMVTEAVEYAKQLCSDVEFSPEDAARTQLDYMCDVIRTAIKAGATVINIPDTVGYAQPEEFANRISYVLNHIPEASKVIISVHCHNDLGLAVANSLAAIKKGATQVECTINGIGERAGNAALEEVVMNIKTRRDYFNNFYTTINTKEIYRTSRLVAELTGIHVQRNKAIVGQNAFAHEAGIHQHGVLRARETYEIMKPEDIGWGGTNIVIGKHSGRHAVKAILQEMGYDLNKEQLDKVMNKMKLLADKQKEVTRDDLIAIATDIICGLSKEEESIKLEELKVITGNKIKPKAIITLTIDGKKQISQAIGVGPVDAVSNAIKNLVGSSISLKEYNLKAITGGTDALAEVTIKVEDQGRIFKAEAVNEDVIMASAIALIQGINKALAYRKVHKNERK